MSTTYLADYLNTITALEKAEVTEALKTLLAITNVNNTSDMDKPLSTAMLAALDEFETSITGITGTLSSHTSAIATLQTDLDTAEDTLADLITELDAVEATVADTVAALSTAEGDIDTLQSGVGALETAVATLDTEKADVTSPHLLGTPLAPTAAPGTNTTQLANTAFVTAAVTAAINALRDGADGAYDTFMELQALMEADDTQTADIIAQLSTKASTTLVNTKITAPTTAGADRILFWDESASAWANLQVGSGLTISGTVLTADVQAPAAASMTVAGIIEISTGAENTTGTDNTRAVSPLGMKDYVDDRLEEYTPTGDVITPHSFTTDSRGTSAYTMPVAAASKHVVWVNVGGVPLSVDDYNVSGTAFTFAYDPGSGLAVELKIAVGMLETPVAAPDSITAAMINEADATAIRDKIDAAYAADGVPVGMIFHSPTGALPAGYLYAEGGTFLSAVYPQLYAYLGTTTLPDYRDRVPRGAGTLAGSAGTTQEDAIQNITGRVGGSAAIGLLQDTSQLSGAFKAGPGKSVRNDYINTSGYDLEFDASLSVRTSTETRVKSYIGRFVIKAYSAPTNLGDYDLEAIEMAINTLRETFTLLNFRNKIINGDFDVWQRATSQTASGFGSDDRWVNTFAGGSLTHSQQAFTLGQTDVPGSPRYFSRSVVTHAAGAGNLHAKVQSIEDIRGLSGQTVTVTFWAKADAAKNIGVEFLQGFGTGGSPSAQVSIPCGLKALTTAWQKFSFTAVIPSIAGKTLGSNGNECLYFIFWFESGSTNATRASNVGQQSGTFDIAHVSVVRGDATLEADPFTPRPVSVEEDLCYRYYERLVASTSGMYPLLSYAYSSFSNLWCVWRFKVKKRAIPTMSAGTWSGVTPSSSYPQTDCCAYNATSNFYLNNGGWVGADAEIG